jgi:hypothetical protein
MTAPDIRDLLTELADTVDSPDAAHAAWAQMLRRRARRRMAVGAGAAASVLVVGGGAAYLRGGDGRSDPTHPGPTVTRRSEAPPPLLDGYRVWTAPTLEREADAPAIDSTLPSTIDLSAPNPSLDEAPIDRAIAAFGIVKIVGDIAHDDGVMLVTEDGELRHADTPPMHNVTSQRVDAFFPFNAGSLSPDGTKLAVVADGGIAVCDLHTGGWTSYDLPGDMALDKAFVWSDDSQTVRLGRSLVDLKTGEPSLVKSDETLLDETPLHVESWWGPEHIEGDNHARGAAYLDEARLPVNGVQSNPPAVVVDGGTASLLLIPDQMRRWKNCCAVAGWLDPRTVAYESRFGGVFSGQTIRVLGWDVLDGHVGLVSTITGSRDMQFLGSYADLSIR